MCEAWISFAGTVLGGGLTLLGVAITIRYYKAQEAKDAESERNAGIMMFYNFFAYKSEFVKERYTIIGLTMNGRQLFKGDVFIQNQKIYFLYERIHYLKIDCK